MRASEYINLNAGVLKPPRGKFSAGFYINRPAGEATFEKSNTGILIGVLVVIVALIAVFPLLVLVRENIYRNQ